MTEGKPIGTLDENLDHNTETLDIFYGEDEDEGGVITFLTISHELFEEWEKVNNDRWEEKTEFDIDNVLEPGVYRDDELREEGSEDCYTVVVPYDFLAPKLIADRLEKLNEKYGTDFELVEDEEE